MVEGYKIPTPIMPVTLPKEARKGICPFSPSGHHRRAERSRHHGHPRRQLYRQVVVTFGEGGPRHTCQDHRHATRNPRRRAGARGRPEPLVWGAPKRGMFFRDGGRCVDAYCKRASEIDHLQTDWRERVYMSHDKSGTLRERVLSGLVGHKHVCSGRMGTVEEMEHRMDLVTGTVRDHRTRAIEGRGEVTRVVGKQDSQLAGGGSCRIGRNGVGQDHVTGHK